MKSMNLVKQKTLSKVAPKTRYKHATTQHGAWWITKFAKLVVANYFEKTSDSYKKS